MTKLFYTIGFMVLMMCTTSCGKWLDVESVKEASEDDMFSNTKGFYSVLNGLYLRMGESSLYGQNMTWGALDAWGRVYELNASVTAHEGYIALRDLNYEAKKVKGFASSMWEYGYKIIARANNLIQNIEKKDSSFFQNLAVEKGLLMGEAKAVRALMHLDLLRVFGQSAELDAAGAYIPWVDEYPSVVNPPVSSEIVLARVIADLEESKTLLAVYDTLKTNQQWLFETSNRFNEKVVPPAGSFYSSRGSHLNYLAVTGVLARAYLWAGDHDKALEQAAELVKYVTNKRLAFTPSTSITTNPKMMDDVLFALYNKNLIDGYSTYCDPTSSSAFYIEDPDLFKQISADKRVNLLGTKNVLTKYMEGKTTDVEELIPMFRLSEAFYIAGECYAKAGDMTSAVDVLNTVRKARGISAKLSNTLSETEFMEELISDARKDLCGEGQLLFLYKRLNKPVYYSAGGRFMHNGKLVMPKPTSESAM